MAVLINFVTKKMPSSELLAPLRGPLTRLGLISQECFNELFVKYNYSNAACLKAFLSKGLGFAIVAGGDHDKGSMKAILSYS